MDLGYPIVPFVAWLAAGSLKFVINSIRVGEPAVGLIGYGGMPSNHTTIVTRAVALVGIREGIEHPAFGIGLALLFIVVIDARSLRVKVGHHARAINRLTAIDRLSTAEGDSTEPDLRERMGHSRGEIAGGVVVGVTVAFVIDRIFAAIL